MIHAIIFWIFLALIFVVLELGHPGLLFFLSFAFGSLAAAAARFFDYALLGQLVIFFVMTIVAMIFLRTFLKKMHKSIYQTNVYALIGKHGIVTNDINPYQPGYITLEGQTWLARSVDNQTFNVQMKVRIVGVRGAHVLVDKITF